MTYTYQNAQWGNAAHTAAVAVTNQVGSVAISSVDTPSDWNDFQTWITGGGVPAAYVAPPPDEGPWQIVLPADLTMNSSTLANVTGLSPNLWANRRYFFEYELWFRTAAVTTGILFTVTGPASPVGIEMTTETCLTMPSASAATFFVQRISAYDGGVPTPSIDVAAADRLVKIRGYIQTAAAGGPLTLRWRSEVNLSQITLRLGSRVRVWAV